MGHPMRTPCGHQGHARSTHRVLVGYSAGTHRAPGHRARAPASTTKQKRAVHDDASETTNKQAGINRTTKRGDKANQKAEQRNTETTKQPNSEQAKKRTNPTEQSTGKQTNKQTNLEFQAVDAYPLHRRATRWSTHSTRCDTNAKTNQQTNNRTIDQSTNRKKERPNKQTHLELQAVDADAVHRRAVRRDGRAPRRDALEPQ